MDCFFGLCLRWVASLSRQIHFVTTMQQLTPQGQNLINDISRRYNLSHDSAVRMLVAVNQGGGSSLTFTSQYGTLSTLSLPLVSGRGLQPGNPTNFAAAPAPAFQPGPPPQLSGHLVTLLEKLGQLRDAGILTPEEFSTKKSELLNRL